MQNARTHVRFTTSMAIAISSVLATHDAVVTDISEGGAQVTGATIPQGTRVWITHEGRDYYGMVAWTEIDRMGIKFNNRETGLAEAARQAAFTAISREARAPRVTGFGRRLAA